MIFSEDTLRRRDYRLLYEERASGCLKNADGTFAPKNQCQDDGAGGSGSQSVPKTDDSWRNSSDDVELNREQLKQSSPIKDGDKIDSLAIQNPRQTSRVMKSLGVKSLDDMVAIGGGAVRGASIVISDLEGDAISVSTRAPVDPSDPSSPSATGTIIVMPGSASDGVVVDYSNFATGSQVSDASKQEGGENSARRLRVASVLKQRMLESLMAAEASGFGKAATMAIGRKGDPNVKGYRLWPQFGFDAKLPRDLAAKIPDEIILRAAGIPIPAPGSSRLPHATVLRGLRSQVREVTVQQLMQFREGENWWTENGSSVEMTLDLRDKNSLGYKLYEKERAKLPSLRRRNEGRSWYPIDDSERRSCDGSDKDESGQFTTGNDCGGSGSGSAPRPPSRAKREQWRKSEESSVSFGQSQATPLIGGERVRELTIQQPQKVAKALDKIGIKDLDSAVKIGGGAIRDSEIVVKSYGTETVAIRISSPIDPEDPDSGSVMTSVDIWDYGVGEREVHYGGLSTPGRVSDPSRLEAGARDKTRLRIASLMQERMIESLLAAQKAGIDRASTYAAGDKDDGMYQGYRLWPQFGFDAELDLSQYQVPPEIILASFKKKAPESAAEAAKQAKKLTSKGFTLQQLISTREGKKWWDDNGSSLDMYLDLKDRKSLGYKRLAKLKRVLPKLKDRNVAEGRTLLGWIIEEVGRRSMSLMGFLGGLGRAIERRDCGPSDKEADGTFAPGNDCQEDAGQGGDSVATIARKAKERDVDVMLGGGKRVAVIDKEARDRAVEDFKSNPKPAGSAPGSTTDLWEREMVSRAPGKVQKKTGKASDGKIESSDPVFPEEDRRQNGLYIAHEAVGQYLANRHEEARRETGAEGPAAIIDTAASEIPEAQMRYLVDSLTEDALHAYDVLGVDPGFYSTDLEDTMRQMSQRHPEFESDENARFIFTALLAITSTGQGPDANLRDADDLYRMFREHGTVVPSNYGGGARDVTASLKVFQGLIDSFGLERTRRLVSGYTTAGKIEAAFARLAGKSQTEEWRQRTGSSAWSLPVDSKGKKKDMISGELKDEVTPISSIFGPKIGAFFANLSGRHEFLTMDRWLMRSVGRVSGELITRMKPEGAKERATDALKALESGKWSRDKLFGVDRTHGITKAALIRSLKIQARTGVIEENGAAFVWATAAERSHGKTKRPSGGGYGKHPDPEIHDLHAAGNSIFKALILEQQDPKTATARRNIREVFRRVQSEIEKKTGRKADIDEIQAALWQYEKRLWKHLGAKTNITENSLFSAAAEGVISGRIKREKPFVPASRRSTDFDFEDDPEDDFDANHFDAEQSSWLSAFADLDIDLLEVLKLLEEDVEERRNFAALDAVIEERSADCGRDDGGKFGDGNTCAAAGVSNSKGESFRGVRRKSDKTQTKVARKLYQMRVPEKNLKGLVRSLGGKVSNTLVEINSDPGDRGVNVFVRDRDNNETHYIHIGYYGATIFPVGGASASETSRIQSSAKQFLPKDIDKKLWGRGNEYPVYVVNDQKKFDEAWGNKTSKQRYKETRSADCGRVEGGKFGPKNQCQEDAGQGGDEHRPAIQSVSGNTVSSGSQWRKVNEATRFSGSEIPTKSLSRAESVDIIDGKLLSGSLKKVGVSLDDAAKVCAANLPGARVSIVHGNVKDFVEWSDDPANHPDPKPTVTFMSNVPVSGIEGAAQVGVSLTNEDGSLFLDYGLLKVSEEGKKAAPLALAREMMRSVANSISEAERIGVSAVYMQAAGSADDDEFKGYRIWPRMGFDGVIPRDIVTPTWSLQTGFFNRYGSSIPDKILSPRARKEKASGELTIQALYETKEGQEWWEKNGRGMEMSMTIGDDESVGWQRFGKMRSRLTGRDGDERDLLDWLDAEWRGFREDVEIRSADCGRVEGGKFGPKNQCQEDAGQGDEQPKPKSSPLDTNENKTWTPADGDEPFEGASRFSEVRASGGKKVAESLGKIGIDPGDALDATGAPDGADIWMRPAPEFLGTVGVSGSQSPPVMINFEADVAGVRRGLSGSSVIGSVENSETGEVEKIIYHSVFDASPSVQRDPAKRHIAARAFYRTMVASIEAARKNGIAEIKFSAAGVSSEKSPSAFRGYTIWPRMGFDAKLPDRIRAKLPESLSHATSLLDLHATREGTKWWAENGEDIDVSFRVGDRSSPQSKIMDRFIQHFMKERREMPLGTGDDWLSPEDLLRLDEMWQEVWDEGDLDDYEYVERRSADCGRTDDGRFGPKNECQEEGSGGPESLPVATKKKDAAYSSMMPGTAEKDITKSVKVTRGPERFGVVGSAARNIPVGDSEATEKYSRETITDVGGFPEGFAGEVSDRLKKLVAAAKSGNPGQDRAARDQAAAAVASIISAAEEMPEIVSERLEARTVEEIAQIFASDNPSVDIDVHRQQAAGIGAMYGLREDAIVFNTDGASQMIASLIENDSLPKGRKFFSTSQVGHALVHEVGHRVHFQAIRKHLGIPLNTSISDEDVKRVQVELTDRMGQVEDYVRRISTEQANELRTLSSYSGTSPLETVAEYFAAVKIGRMKRSATIDRVVEILGFPLSELIPAKKKKR